MNMKYNIISYFRCCLCHTDDTPGTKVTSASDERYQLSRYPLSRDFPDHATFRENGAKLSCADKLGVFLSLTLCKKANFEYLSFIK